MGTLSWIPVWALDFEFCAVHGGMISRYSESGDARGIFRVLFYNCSGQQCHRIVRA